MGADAAGACAPLKGRAVAGRNDHHSVFRAAGERFTNHHARLGPGVGICHTHHTSDDLSVAAERLINVMKLIGVVPDIDARTDNGPVATRRSCAARRGNRPDILMLPAVLTICRLSADKPRW